MSNVTVIITSCNRFDLLEKTLTSFMKFNTYPIKDYHLHNDGGSLHLDRIQKKFPFINIIHSSPRIGYSKSLDKLLQLVETEYVFTLEDDWKFHQNPGFIEKSLLILNACRDLHQVWIRDIEDHGHPQGDPYEIFPNIMVRDVDYGYKKIWNGFSLNPGLRRMSDWKKWFPNGLSYCGDGDEATLAQHTAKFGYRAVSLVNSSMVHLGWNRRSINFKP